MKTLRIFSILLLIISFSAQLFSQDYKYLDNKAGLSEITTSNGIDKPVTVKIIYDNYVHENGLVVMTGCSQLWPVPHIVQVKNRLK
jgi:hypothetical protein